MTMAKHFSYYDTADKVDAYIRKDAAYADLTHRIMLDLLKDLPSTGRVLDAGCGYGRDTKYLSDQGYDAIGVDQSTAMVKEAVKRYGPHFQVLPLQKLTDLSETFDLVWCRNVLVHVEEKEIPIVLDQLNAVTAQGGTLILISKEGQGVSVSHTTGSPRETILHSKEEIAEQFQGLGMSLLEPPYTLPAPSAKGDKLFCMRLRKTL